jgi:UDP-N-acetylmuramate dehydrogenase
MTLSYDPPKLKTSSNSEYSPVAVDGLRLQIDQKPTQVGHDCLIKPQVSLAPLTSFRVGGAAEWYVAPRTVEDLATSVAWAEARQLPITILGAGSNLLISDRGLPGLVIGTRRLRYNHFDLETGLLTVGAGEPLPKLAWQAADRGMKGWEWAVGIPGTVGGAVVMNAGAHGGCIAEYLTTAEVLLPDGMTKLLTPKDLNFRYRTSALQNQRDWFVTRATFQLQPGFDPVVITAATGEHLDHRRTTQPYHMPSCGSVFRNPGDYKAGWLIEQTGLKGHQIGGAQVAQRHANFILNCGGATATDIFQLIRHVQQQVEDRWSLWLEPEVKMLGEFQPV